MAVSITATRTSTLFTDNDLDGVFDPGDIILTKIRITNNGDADGTTVSVTDTLNGVTLVPGSVQVTPIAFDDLMPSITGNTPITFTAAQLLGNDVDPDGAEINLTITGVSNAVNGAIVNNGNGTFTFTPTTGFTGAGAGGASFQYSIQDEQTLGSVTTGIVRFDVTDPTWYVDASYTGVNGASDGSYLKPFTSLVPLSTGGSADALDNANDTIFVYNAGTYADASIVLETGQKLFGDGHAYSVNGLTIGANASNTTLGHTGTAVTLASGNTVMGLTLNGTANGAIGIDDGGATVGTLIIDETSITGLGKAIDIDQGGAVTIDLDQLSSASSTTEGVHLQGLTGTFNASTGTIQTSTGSGVLIGAAGGGTASSGGTVDFTYGGDITSPGGSLVEIQDRTGGTVTFSGVLTEGTINAGQTGILIDGSAGTINFNGQTFVSAGAGTGNGVTLTNNSGTINFAPTGTGLDITTTSGTGLTFTGGGTLNITGAANSIVTGTGQIMNLGGTMGTSGIAFQTLTSGTTAGNAININNLDAAGAGIFSGGTVTIGGSGADGINISGGSNSTFNFASATIDNTTGDGIELNGANGAVTFTTVNLDTLGGHGVSINGATNAVTISGGTIGTTNDAATDGVNITGGTGAVTINAAVGKSTAGNVVDISGHNTGTIAFGGTLTSSAGSNGISITGNTGGTINFTGANTTISTGAAAAINIGTNGAAVNFSGGGLLLTTAGATAFSATGGGSVSITGAGNIITSGTGRAINLDSGTIINGSGITLQQVNASGGATTAIYLNNTTASVSAGFTITGTGTTDASGGIIGGITGADGSNTAGIGIYLNNTDNVVLQNIDFGSLFNNFAIRGNEVNNFTLRNSDFGDSDQFDNTIGSNGAFDEGAILFTNLTGTGLFEGNEIWDAYEDVVSIENNTGTLVVTFQDTGAQQAIIGKNDEDSDGIGAGVDIANGNDGILIESNGNANITVNITGVEFKGARADMVQTNTQANSTMNVTIQNSSFLNLHNDITSGGGGIRVGGGGATSNYTATYLISNNDLKGAEGDAIHAVFQGQSATISGVIINNRIGTDDAGNPDGTSGQATTGSSANGNGIHVGAENFDGAGQMNHSVRIESNVIRDIFFGSGIRVLVNGDDDLNSTRVETRILNNNIEEMGNVSFTGINFVFGGGTQTEDDRSTLGVIMTGNTVNLGNVQFGNNAIVVDQANGPGSLTNGERAHMYVPGYTPSGPLYGPSLTTFWEGAGQLNVLTNGAIPNEPAPSKVDSATVTAGGVTNTAFVLPAPLIAMVPAADWEAQARAEQAAYQAAQNAATVTSSQGGETAVPAAAAAAAVLANYVASLPAGGRAAAQIALDRDSTLAEARAAGHAARDGSGQAAAETGGAFVPAGDTAPASAPAADDGIVSQAELDLLVDAAIQRWIAAGATAEQVAAMRATTVSVTDMAGIFVGSSSAGEILVDSDGAGHGWFIDSTPLGDSEFDGTGSRLAADAGGAADGKIDLLTVIMHELGHQIGLDDGYQTAESDELMYGYVNIGERRLPGSDDAIGAVPGSVTSTAYALTPVSIGTLPPGKAVDVFFKSTIDSQTDKLITNLNNDSTVSGNFVNVVANEVNALDTLTLGNLVFLDVNEDGNYDAGTDTGIVGVSVSLYADTNDDFAWDPGDVLLGSQSTLAGGLYSFTGLAPGDYIVVVNAANFTSGQPLDGKVSIAGGNDPDDNADDDDNGVPGTGGAIASQTITLAYNEEPTAGTGNDTNNTLDFGFITPDKTPTLTATAVNPTFNEGAVAADLFNTVAASTVDAGQTFASMTLTVTNVTDGANEVLTFDGSQVALTNGNSVVGTATNGLTVNVTVAAGTATVSFSGATLTAVQLQTLIDALAYSNTSQNPTDANRVVTITQLVDSGSNTPPDSNTATLNIVTTVNVEPINDAPAGADASDATPENVDMVFDVANFSTGMTDPENHTLSSVVITTLPATGTIKLNNVAIIAGAEITLLQLTNGNLTYTPPGVGSGGTSPTFTFQVRDNGGIANGGVDLDQSPNTFTINITTANLFPVVDLDGAGGTNDFASAYTEGGAAAAIADTDVDITDADGTTIASATITITDALAGDALSLSGALPGTIIVDGTSTATVLKLTGSGTHAEYEQALALVRYSSSSDNPTALGTDLERTVTVIVNDGISPSAASTTTITITDVNDPPVGTSATITAVEDSFRLFDAADFGFSDPDGTFAGVTISGVTGGDIYFDADGTAGAGTPVVETLPKTYTAQDLIDGKVSFKANADANGAGIGTVTFAVIDDDSATDASPNLLTVDVTPINDSPVVPDSPTIGVNEQTTITLNAAIAISDVDLDARNGGAGDYGGSTFTIKRTAPSAQDLFNFDPTSGALFTINGSNLQSGGLTFATFSQVGGILNVSFTSSGTTATTALVNNLLSHLQYTNLSNNPPSSVTLVYALDDGAPGGGQGALGAPLNNIDSGQIVINLTAVNDAPVNVLGGTIGTGEDAVNAWLSGMSISDPDANAAADDILITFDVDHGVLAIRTNVTFGISALDIISQTATTITVQATINEINTTLAAANGLTYSPDLNYNGNDTLTVTTNDRGFSGLDPALSGDANSEEDIDTRTITISAVDDLPDAQPDAVTTAENAIGTGSLFVNNGSGPDSDLEGDAFVVAAVNGSGAAVGTEITLASGAKLTVNADGTYSYNPNGKFNTLTNPSSGEIGAVNTQAVDTFTYTLNGGDTATVTMTITGVVSPEDRLEGDATDNTITGTPGNDYFLVTQGGDDTLSGLGGNDFFFFGAALTGNDAADGGGGNDQIAIQGNYSLTLGTGIINMESLVLLPGNDIRFGDTANNFYDYVLGTVDENIAAGQRLIVDANRLRVGEDFTFNASAETNGNVFIVGGHGVDIFTGGSQSDTFLFGETGQWGSSDVVNGTSGLNDQLALRGNYSITFGAGQLLNIDSIALVSAFDTRFGSVVGAGFDYNLTMNDANLAAGQLMTIDGAVLRSNETLNFNGSAETNGNYRVVGGETPDTIIGGAQADILIGRGNGDSLTGGGGSDTFRYDKATDSTFAQKDTIQDFTLGDVIDLSRIDANSNTAANDAFSFIGTGAFTGTAGQLRFQPDSGTLWLVQGDTDGNGVADLELWVNVTDASPITSGDFIL